MEIIIKSGAIKRKKFELDDENEKLLEKLANELGMDKKAVLQAIIKDEEIDVKEDKNLKNLQEELLSLQKEMFRIEGEWSSIRYKSHVIAHEIKNLSVALIGLLNQNRMLRRQLNMHEEYDDLRKLAEEYLFMKMKS